MPVYNVTCNGQNDGKICFTVNVPNLNAFIKITNTTVGTDVTDSPVTTPIGAVVVPYVAGVGVEVDTNGEYCWENLAPGTYTIKVSDSSASPCVTEATAEVIEPLTVSVDYEVIYSKCDGNVVDVQATGEGGTEPFIFTLENVGGGFGPITKSSGLFKNIPIDLVNDYTLTITDIKGCSTSIDFKLDSASTVVINVGSENVKCFGMCNGSISVIATGGTPSYTYILTSDPEGTFAEVSCPDEGEETSCDNNYQFKNLCPGDYNVKVIDSKGCSTEYPNTVTITEPDEIVITGPTVTEITCNNCCDASISIDSIVGGTANYTVEITTFPEGAAVPGPIYTDGSSPSVFEDLSVGEYVVTITDKNGCKKEVKINILKPDEIEVSL